VARLVKNLAGRAGTFRVRTPFVVSDTVTAGLKALQSAVKELEDHQKFALNREELTAARRLVGEAETFIREFLEQPDMSLTYWAAVEKGTHPSVSLHAAPTSVAECIGGRLFQEGRPVILTGATLSINGSLAYAQQRLGASRAETLILDSPFDFRRQMRIVIARDIPPPEHEDYEKTLPQFVYHCLMQSHGKALVLFTNLSVMRSVAGALREKIEPHGITLLVQDGNTTRHRLLETFKADISSVLFGLDSFWMGIDVPGEALEHVIITKLPFAVPDHPLVESRMELIDRHGGNAFLDFTLPEAVLKFKQGVGRLIRSRKDKGLVSILDSRILTKSYGRVFLQSLPSCSVELLSSDGTTLELSEL
jgi:ATP-dependent DNA helicase DinG